MVVELGRGCWSLADGYESNAAALRWLQGAPRAIEQRREGCGGRYVILEFLEGSRRASSRFSKLKSSCPTGEERLSWSSRPARRVSLEPAEEASSERKQGMYRSGSRALSLSMGTDVQSTATTELWLKGKGRSRRLGSRVCLLRNRSLLRINLAVAQDGAGRTKE